MTAGQFACGSLVAPEDEEGRSQAATVSLARLVANARLSADLGSGKSITIRVLMRVSRFGQFCLYLCGGAFKSLWKSLYDCAK